MFVAPAAPMIGAPRGYHGAGRLRMYIRGRSWSTLNGYGSWIMSTRCIYISSGSVGSAKIKQGGLGLSLDDELNSTLSLLLVLFSSASFLESCSFFPLLFFSLGTPQSPVHHLTWQPGHLINNIGDPPSSPPSSIPPQVPGYRRAESMRRSKPRILP